MHEEVKIYTWKNVNFKATRTKEYIKHVQQLKVHGQFNPVASVCV